jgi:glycine dehydrogenase subunit 1
MNEIEVTRRFQQRALKDSRVLSFVGAGAYHHHIPAPVSLASNPNSLNAKENFLAGSNESKDLAESLSALTAMDETHYAGSDLIAAVLHGIEVVLNIRKKHQTGRILIASTVNPFYRKAIRTWLKHRGIDPAIVHYDEDTGVVGLGGLRSYDKKSTDILIIQYPNFFGVIEPVNKIAKWAHDSDIALMAIVNPLALGALKPPGGWGKYGADMAVYDLQTLGLPICLSGSAPGFISIKQRLVEQLASADKTSAHPQEAGQADYWMLARAEAYLNYLGASGLARIAQQCAQNLASLERSLLKNPVLSLQFDGTRFHECVVNFNQVDLPAVLSLCARHGFRAGYPLESEYPELGQCVLFNATESHLPEDIDAMVSKLSKVVEVQSKAVCPVKPKF